MVVVLVQYCFQSYFYKQHFVVVGLSFYLQPRGRVASSSWGEEGDRGAASSNYQ